MSLPDKPAHLVPQALTFIIFICFTASISAYMAAALLEFFITLAFLFLYATQYYQRFDRLNWPCLVRPLSPALFSSECRVFLSSSASSLFLGPSTRQDFAPSCWVTDNEDTHFFKKKF